MNAVLSLVKLKHYTYNDDYYNSPVVLQRSPLPINIFRKRTCSNFVSSVSSTPRLILRCHDLENKQLKIKVTRSRWFRNNVFSLGGIHGRWQERAREWGFVGARTRRRKDNGRAKCACRGWGKPRFASGANATEIKRERERKKKIERERKGRLSSKGGHERSKKRQGKKERRGGRARKKGKERRRDVWTSPGRDGWVRLEQTRVRGIIKRFIRLLSRSYSALFIRPVSLRFFFLATSAPLSSHSLSHSLSLCPFISLHGRSNSTKGAEWEMRRR